jgi:hypothetical protein
MCPLSCNFYTVPKFDSRIWISFFDTGHRLPGECEGYSGITNHDYCAFEPMDASHDYIRQRTGQNRAKETLVSRRYSSISIAFQHPRTQDVILARDRKDHPKSESAAKLPSGRHKMINCSVSLMLCLTLVLPKMEAVILEVQEAVCFCVNWVTLLEHVSVY